MNTPKWRTRPIERGDLALLRDWRNSDNVRHRTREYRLLNLLNQEEWFEHVSRDRNQYLVVIEAEKAIGPSIGWEPIGVMGLCHINWIARHGELSIYIGPTEYQGKGLGIPLIDETARIGFEELNLNRIWLEYYGDMTPGWGKKMQANGWHKEGELREHYYKLGQYGTSVVLGMLRHEWVSRKGEQRQKLDAGLDPQFSEVASVSPMDELQRLFASEETSR